MCKYFFLSSSLSLFPSLWRSRQITSPFFPSSIYRISFGDLPFGARRIFGISCEYFFLRRGKIHPMHQRQLGARRYLSIYPAKCKLGAEPYSVKICHASRTAGCVSGGRIRNFADKSLRAISEIERGIEFHSRRDRRHVCMRLSRICLSAYERLHVWARVCMHICFVV